MRYICIDVGLKRIGLAFSDGSIVLPINPVLRKNRNQAAADTKKIIDEYRADTLVAGVPMGGASQDEMRRRIEHFTSLLNFKGDIAYIDESFSSMEASELQKDANSSNKKRNGRLDSLAAMVILKRFLKL